MWHLRLKQINTVWVAPSQETLPPKPETVKLLCRTLSGQLLVEVVPVTELAVDVVTETVDVVTDVAEILDDVVVWLVAVQVVIVREVEVKVVALAV